MARGYRRNHYGKHSPFSRKGKPKEDRIMNGEVCEICGEPFEHGITIQKHKKGFVHPECLIGVPIDHGD